MLELVVFYARAHLKTTSWEISKEGFSGGSSKPATLVSDIYFVMNAINQYFTNEIARESKLVYNVNYYGEYCIKLIEKYREILEEYYGKDSVQAYLVRYSVKPVDDRERI